MKSNGSVFSATKRQSWSRESPARTSTLAGEPDGGDVVFKLLLQSTEFHVFMLDAALEAVDRHDRGFRRFAEVFEQPACRAPFKDANLKDPEVRCFFGHSRENELPTGYAAAEPVLGKSG